MRGKQVVCRNCNQKFDRQDCQQAALSGFYYCESCLRGLMLLGALVSHAVDQKQEADIRRLFSLIGKGADIQFDGTFLIDYQKCPHPMCGGIVVTIDGVKQCIRCYLPIGWSLIKGRE